jgi:hypothetical protein
MSAVVDILDEVEVQKETLIWGTQQPYSPGLKPDPKLPWHSAIKDSGGDYMVIASHQTQRGAENYPEGDYVISVEQRPATAGDRFAGGMATAGIGGGFLGGFIRGAAGAHLAGKALARDPVINIFKK